MKTTTKRMYGKQIECQNTSYLHLYTHTQMNIITTYVSFDIQFYNWYEERI